MNGAAENRPGPPEPPEPSGEALRVRRGPPDARAAVLFLHGGTADSTLPTSPAQPAALRMRPFRAAVARRHRDVLTADVRYRVRGWNGTAADPLRDTLRALDELAARTGGGLPVVLVGHSMGGRAALRAASRPEVRGVVALAPWCPPGEPVGRPAGTRVVVLHGTADRITDPAGSDAWVRRARAAGSRARLLLVRDGDHAMLRRAGLWHRTAADAVTDLLAPDGQPGGPDGDAEREPRTI
ncbi:alpha/beta hydrolase [Streptomyces sp. NPDC090306]|uniref:alpha/beta hydrolase n=1 Tax=Streptomyces sp. NPDC090306 TaxID=3365961 RepID=UPI00381C6A89